jgi:hypothetical protein
MAPKDVDRQLVEILTEYYPDANTAKQRAMRAGIDVDQLDLSGAVGDVWARIVQWARQRKKTIALIDEARADFDRDDLRALKVAELGETDRYRAMHDVGDALAEHIDRLRDEMRHMEGRLVNRIEQVETKVDSLKAVSLMYTSKKRTAWMIGFLLFCLPCFLFLHEVREALDLATPAAVLFIVTVWTVAAGFFLYGLGYLRDL